MPASLPTLGGRYHLGPELGRGGMSTVYRAVDLQTDRLVAVKVYAPGATFDARTRQQREATLGAGLRHDGIVPILDHGEHEDTSGTASYAYLVTELVDGSTLRDRLNHGRCTPSEVAALGSRLCSALGYLHEHGIVHRDIKPANVLLNADGDLRHAMLADFGVAIRLEDTRVTVDGFVVGTAAYLSPEQVSGKPITPASDIYSLGLVLIEALSGVSSYEGSGVECALARLHRQPEIPADVPEWLSTLLTAMTARDPENRPTAFDAEVAFDLGNTVSDGATAVLETVAPAAEPVPMVYALPDQPTSELAIPQDSGRSPRLVGLLAVAAVVVLALTAGALASRAPSGFPTPPMSKTTFPAPTLSSSVAPQVAAKLSTSAKPPAPTTAKPTPKPAPKPAPKPGPGRHHGGGHAGPALT